MKQYIRHIALFIVTLLVAEFSWGQTDDIQWVSLKAPAAADDKTLDNANEHYAADVSDRFYRLNEDITLNDKYRYKLEKGKNITIDLNGHTFNANEMDIALFNVGYGVLTIIDSSPQQTGMIRGTRKTCFYLSSDNANHGVVLNLKGGTIEDCQPSNGEGGAVEVERVSGRGNVIFNMSGGVIQNCSASQGGGVYVNGGEFNMTAGKIVGNKIFSLTRSTKNPSWDLNVHGNNLGENELPIGINSKDAYDGKSNPKDNHYDYKGGGVYVEAGTFNMSGGIISQNVAVNGGGVYVVDNAEFNLSGGTISDNYASSLSNSHGNGGAIYIAQNSECTITGSSITPIVISGNRVTRCGGGIYINNSTMTLTNCNVKGNFASSGGGIVQENTNTEKTMTLEDSQVNINHAKGTTGVGGGIYMVKGNFIAKGNISMNGNEAYNGGAICVDGGEINSEQAIFTNIENNKADEYGGAFYVVNGDITLGKTELVSNKAKNGGAIALMNGGFDIDGSSEINRNTATENGGGLFVSNTGTSKKTISCEGGSFNNNEAKNGGGIYVSGNPSNVNGIIDLTFAADVQTNTATDGVGGGIYISDRVNMKFGNGLVRSNKALQSENKSIVYTTAEAMKAGSVAGVGGGIFMGNNSTLVFTSTEMMGIYGNSAANAGADICVNGNGTTITLPNIQKMNLRGFDVIGNDLYWVEDYFTNETKTFSTLSGIRYENALIQGNLELEGYIVNIRDENNQEIPQKDFKNKYLCLDLGYDMVFVTLTTEGLVGNEIITMSYPMKVEGVLQKDNPILYREITFNGNTSKVVGLPSGYWQLGTKGLNYKCDVESCTPTPDSDKYIHVTKELISKEIIIGFGQKEGGLKNVVEAQSRVVNKMKAN